MRKTTRFRERLKEPGIIVMPGAYDAITAKLIEQTGYEIIYVGGATLANAHIGVPDVGLTTVTELAELVHRIACVTTLPIYVDADTGFGNAINAMRTVRELEQAGAAGLHLEDQVFPKRCGHFAGKQVVSELEMCKKLEAACEARQDDDFVIIARTDARAVLGFDEAVKRARAYLKAGADGIFFESPISVEELAAVPKLFEAPTQANMVSGGGQTPLMKYQDLEAMGFKLVNYGAAPFQVAVKAILGLLEDIKVTGSTQNYLDRMVSFDERQRRVGLPAIAELQKRFGTEEQ